MRLLAVDCSSDPSSRERFWAVEVLIFFFSTSLVGNSVIRRLLISIPSPRPFALNSIFFFSMISRFLSNNGRPHPHLVHLRSICCAHIRCQTTSSSAMSRQRLETCAALQREVVSRKQRTRKPSSAGRAERKSILSSDRRLLEMEESCGKQHWLRMPCSMRSLCFPGAAENRLQTWVMACWSE